MCGGVVVALHVAAPNEPSTCCGFLQVLSKYITVLFVSCTVKCLDDCGRHTFTECFSIITYLRVLIFRIQQHCTCMDHQGSC